MSAPGSSTTRARNWDAIAALIAALIGLLALCVSAYTASIQRQQAKAQVWTQLMFANSDTDHALLVLNKGVGPARLESLRLFVDGKAQPDWDHVFAALGVTHQGELRQSTVNGTVIAANERLEYMTLGNAEDWKAFRAQKSRLRARYCYCSVLDECRVFDQRAPRREDAETAVASCERSADEEFAE
jgi:hypothetical protein